MHGLCKQKCHKILTPKIRITPVSLNRIQHLVLSVFCCLGRYREEELEKRTIYQFFIFIHSGFATKTKHSQPTQL